MQLMKPSAAIRVEKSLETGVSTSEYRPGQSQIVCNNLSSGIAEKTVYSMHWHRQRNKKTNGCRIVATNAVGIRKNEGKMKTTTALINSIYSGLYGLGSDAINRFVAVFFPEGRRYGGQNEVFLTSCSSTFFWTLGGSANATCSTQSKEWATVWASTRDFAMTWALKYSFITTKLMSILFVRNLKAVVAPFVSHTWILFRANI